MITIPQTFVESTCKFGHGEQTCRYLLLSGQGFFCAKTNADSKAYFDKRVKDGRMNAKGDNCGGWDPSLIQIGAPRGVS